MFGKGHGKWNKKEAGKNDGQPVATKISLFTDQVYQPKLLKKAPSMRVINNYNNISTNDDVNESYDNLTFIPEDADIAKFSREYDNCGEISLDALNGTPPLSGRMCTSDEGFDYPTMASRSSRTNTVMSSDTDIRRDDLGSTVKLVSPKLSESCRTCLSVVEIVLCTVSLATGIGNLYRLPQAVVGNGGLPFLVAYAILVVLIGLPLLFLELGIGQIVQDGFIKTWRAVPFFRGVGYVKLAAGFLLSIYYPLYMALSLYYLIWFAKETPPFSECAVIRMSNEGYKADGKSGQECIRKTFLESPFQDPYWFSIYAGLLLLIWFIIVAWCLKRTRTYEKALIVFLLCTFACLVALIVKAIDTDQFHEIGSFFTDGRWDILGNAEVWYYAMLQVFFSTNIGFGIFTTNAGIVYKKANPFWTSLGYIFVNLLVGVLSVFLFYTVSHNIDPAPKNTTIYEVHVLTHIYDVVLKSEDVDMQIWSVVAYMTILFAGFISMITIMYTIIKAVSLETKNRIRWWQLSLVLSFLSFLLGCVVLLYPDLDVLHLLDHYVVGNLVLVTVILEVFAFVLFYGPTKLQSDFEFILGNKLSKIWIALWYVCPTVLLAIFVWALSTISLTGHVREDPVWLAVLGWTVVIAAVVVVLVVGFYNVSKQEEYLTIFDKVKATFKHRRNWGPSDTMMRHNWIQWHSKAREGERDFTLKRRGTKEYTHSIKNRSKYEKGGYTPTISDASTASGTLTYKKADNYVEPYYARNSYEKPLRVTSLIDTYGNGYRTNYNPLAYINNANGFVAEPHNDGSTSEGYGTYRKGPYIIEDDGLHHVCHRKNSLHEQATEL